MNDQDAHDRLRQRGRSNLEKALGKEYLQRRDASTTALNQNLRHLSEEFAYGTVWDNDELDPRQRSLLTIALLVALNRPAELRLHIAGAITNGLTTKTIAAAITHSAVYCGLPAAIDSMRILEDAVRESS